MRRLIVLVALFAVGCGSSPAPVAPTPVPIVPSIPACQSNNTSVVSFGNRSAATTQDVVWDGSKVSTISPGQTSVGITAAAGVAHNLQFRVTNTTLAACATSTPIPIQCGSPVYTCAFP